MIDHRQVGTDVFLGGNYVEIGVSGAGSLGSANSAPAGYHPESPTGGVSFVVNDNGLNSGDPGAAGDFTLPGTPEDDIVVGFDGNSYDDDEREGSNQLGAESTDTSTGSTLQATTIGSVNGLNFTQVVSLEPNATYFKTTVTLENSSSSIMDDVRFMRSFDPDQDVYNYGSYFTDNDVLSNPSGSNDLAISQALGPQSGVSVYLVTFDPEARASNFGFTNLDAYDPSAFTAPVDLNGDLVDEAISLDFAPGNLAPGQSATVSFYTSLIGNAGGPGDDMVVGTDGDDTLNGGAGNDIIIGLTGNDDLIGGDGNDTFVFETGLGNDTIGDFTTAPGTNETDRLDLHGLGVNSFSEVRAAAVQQGSDTVIDLGSDSSIRLLGVSLSTFNAANVTFGAPDLASPTPAGLALSPSSDSGVQGDGVTNIVAPTIIGTGETGDTVYLYDGTTQVGTGIVDSDGTWRVTTSILADGDHIITASETDGEGNASGLSTVLPVIIDTVAPGIPGIEGLFDSSDSGVAGDNITNVNQPGLFGLVFSSDATIALYDGEVLVGTGAYSGDGGWVAVVDTPLSDGVHSLTATATDPAGNTSTASVPFDVTIKTSAPIPSGLMLDPSTDSGVLGDGVTNIPQPIIDGQGEAGDAVSLYDGTTLVGTGTVGDDGNWQVTASILADGPHSLTATETDVAANTSAASTPVDLTIKTSAPVPTGLSLDPSTDSGVQGDDITSVTQPAIDGQGEAGDTVDLYDSTTLVGTGTVGSDGTWQITTSFLADGAHSLTANETDMAGNLSAASPPLDLAIIQDNLLLNGNFAADGGGFDGWTVENEEGGSGDWYLQSGATSPESGYEVPEPPVPNAALTDQFGPGSHVLFQDFTVPFYVTSAAFSFDLFIGNRDGDFAAPSSLDYDVEPNQQARVDILVGNPSSEFSVTSSDILSNIFQTQPGDPLVSGYDLVTENLTSLFQAHEGETLQLRFAETDNQLFFNMGIADVKLTAVTVVPPSDLALALASDSGVQGDDITNVTTPTITGSGAAGDIVNLYDDAVLVGSSTVGSDGTWQITTSTLVDGTQSLTATETHTAGNTSAASTPLDLTIKTSAPVPTGLSLDPSTDSGVQGDDITGVSQPAIDGQGEVGDTINLYDDTTLVGTGTVGSDGTWQVTANTLADGPHTLVATETDVAGNVSDSSSPLNLTIGESTGVNLVSGLGGPDGFGTQSLGPNDDGSTSAIDITSVFSQGLNLFGTTYDQIFINNNGNITFAGPLGEYTPTTIGTGFSSPIIAPFWADVDTRGGPTSPTGGNTQGTNLVWYDLDPANQTVTITWDDVGYYDEHTDKTDAFQLQLIGEGGSNFEIKFIYQNINWVAGDASDGIDGLGGTVARIGYSGGNGTNHLETPQSGDQTDLLNLPTTIGNTGLLGTWEFVVNNGTINTSPSSPSDLTLAPISDGGTLGDDLTNINDPEIDGLGEAGDTVNLYDGAALVGTGTVGSDGTWRVTTSILADGLHSLSAIEADGNGDTSGASTPLDLTIKTFAPTPTSLALDASTDSGVIGDNITNIVQPTIDGQGEAGDTVALYDGTTLVGTGTVGSDGTWQVTTLTLADGPHSLTAIEIDAAANTSTSSAPLTLTIVANAIGPTGPDSISFTVDTNNNTVVTGSGNDTINVFGTGNNITGGSGQDAIFLFDGNNTVTGGSGPDTIDVFSSGNTINGAGGDDAISLFGNGNTVFAGSGSDTISVFGTGNSVSGGTGPETISVYNSSDTVSAGSGNDTITIFGNNNAITGGSGFDSITVYGNDNTVVGGSGPDTITVFGQSDLITGAGGTAVITLYGNADTINGGSGLDTISVLGNTNVVTGGTGADTVSVLGSLDTVNLGSGPSMATLSGSNDTVHAGTIGNTTAAQVTFSGSSMTFADGPGTYSDTVTGFSEGAGDVIGLSGSGHTVATSAQVNGGTDTLITLSSGSTILLKGVGHIDNSIFS